MENSRNVLLALVLSAAVIFGWSWLSKELFPVAPPPAAATAASTAAGTQPGTPASPGLAAGPAAIRERTVVLSEAPRVPIRTPLVEGSINLVGARVDDLVLKRYRETLRRGSQSIHLLSPAGTEGEYLASFGFSGGPGAPGPMTRWVLADGEVLAPGKPVTLRYTNAQQQIFDLRFTIDDKYLISAELRVTNRGVAAAVVQPYALITRARPDEAQDQFSAHAGPVGAFGTEHFEVNWDKLRDGDKPATYSGTGGWLGFADRYWLAALIPDQRTPVTAAFRYAAPDRFQADMTRAPIIVGPGRTAAQTYRLFAGAKEVDMLDAYEAELGVPMLDQANDWGTFGFIAKPMFHLLTWLYHLLGNYGLAIIAITFLVRLALFPVANKQFQSMNRMKVLAPKMKELQARYKDDKEGLQRAMLEFYQKEKVNPVAGCLPIFLQIPIFFALYKCFILSIEMRHAPFALWIRDLSAPDPVTPLNLFGILPFVPPPQLLLGVLPIMVGVTMWLQQKLNPAPVDPVQQKVFGFMPWIFMIFMAPFAAGLQLYWFTNNSLSIAQQWWLARRHTAPAAAGDAAPAK